MRAWILIAIALASAPFAWSARPPEVTIPKARLDAYFDALEARGFANGNIAISQKGVVRYQRSLGFAATAPTGNNATDESTRYLVGPVSELFTAVLTMQLVESASITLDSKLAEFFPDLPNALEITYRDLLQHRSGLANYLDADLWARGAGSVTRAAILKYLESAGARFPPRERVEYSGTNYLLLSYILEKVHERPYGEILRRQIAKVGLARTYLRGLGERASLESIAYQHSPAGWVAQEETDPELHLGARGIVSNPTDLVRFVDAVFAANKLVTAQSLATMRGDDGAPGAGLKPWSAAGVTGYGGSGRIAGYAAWVWHRPENGISIAYATNAPVLPMEEIVDEVLALIFERGRKPPGFEPVKLTAAQQQEYVGTWRSAEKFPADTPFREFAQPGKQIELRTEATPEALVIHTPGHRFALMAFGDGEFFMDGAASFVRIWPQRDELVMRDPDHATLYQRVK